MNKRIDDKRRAQARKLAERGVSIAEIARRIKTSDDFVRNLLRAERMRLSRLDLDDWTSVRRFLKVRESATIGNHNAFMLALSPENTARVARALWRSLKKHRFAAAALAERNAVRDLYGLPPFSAKDAARGNVNPWTLCAAARAAALSIARAQAVEKHPYTAGRGSLPQVITRETMRIFTEIEREKEL